MEHDVRVLIGVAFGLLLIMLRLDAERFTAAEYSERAYELGLRASVAFRRRLTWYLMGLVLIVGVAAVSPASGQHLYLRLGDRVQAIVLGFLFAGFGTLQAAGFALLRYGHLRLPPTWSYPGALLNAIGTAFIDEAAFRGILLAYLLATGLDVLPAILLQAIVYALATRLGARGRDPYMLLLVLAIGVVSGWLTVSSLGIGAAFLGHAITRFAVFVCTGHAGRPALPGREVEEIERQRELPPGWQPIGPEESGSFEQ